MKSRINGQKEAIVISLVHVIDFVINFRENKA